MVISYFKIFEFFDVSVNFLNLVICCHCFFLILIFTLISNVISLILCPFSWRGPKNVWASGSTNLTPHPLLHPHPPPTQSPNPPHPCLLWGFFFPGWGAVMVWCWWAPVSIRKPLRRSEQWKKLPGSTGARLGGRSDRWDGTSAPWRESPTASPLRSPCGKFRTVPGVPRAQVGWVPLLAAIPEFQKQGVDLAICRKPSPTDNWALKCFQPSLRDFFVGGRGGEGGGSFPGQTCALELKKKIHLNWDNIIRINHQIGCFLKNAVAHSQVGACARRAPRLIPERAHRRSSAQSP